MNASEKVANCPRCGTPCVEKFAVYESTAWQRIYECRSTDLDNDTTFEQSAKCRITELSALVSTMTLAIWKLRGLTYTDDDVLNRHSHTQCSCEALRELFATVGEVKS